MRAETVEKLRERFFDLMREPDDNRNDTAERSNMEFYIRSGAAFLDSVALDIPIDYEKDARAADLLYNYCFYAKNDCSDKFREAYQTQLTELRYRAVAGKVEREVENAED